jgi:pilus assembly protein CpaF
VSVDHVRRVIERIVAQVGRRIDESSPMVDARLPDGSRVNAVIPPLAVDGPVLTVRKFAREALRIDDLIALSTVNRPVADMLSTCIQGGLAVLVSGGTGTGKTTLLNVLSSFVPEHERIVTIEDAVELQLHQRHVIRLESRPPNIEGRGEVAIRDLVRNALRMRPDRIIVGEVRGAEALDMLQAMNTGHDGSLSTIHANTPRDALSRVETMVMMAGLDLPTRAIREQVASALDLIVHLHRFRDGSRRVTQVTEVVGMEGDVITLSDIFTVDYSAGFGPDGRFQGELRPTGIRPAFSDHLADLGLALPLGLFGGDVFVEGPRW